MKWLVSGVITISVHTEVEAETQSAAEEIALAQPVMSLCHQCATGTPKDEWVTSGELDGDIEVIEIDPA